MVRTFSLAETTIRNPSPEPVQHREAPLQAQRQVEQAQFDVRVIRNQRLGLDATGRLQHRKLRLAVSRNERSMVRKNA